MKINVNRPRMVFRMPKERSIPPCPPARSFARAALLVAGLSLLAHSGPALANEKTCRFLEQRYAQIEKAATSIELNATLFAAADKGCTALAVRLLDAGASLDARDRLGNRPLDDAAMAGEPELVTLFLDKGAAIDAQNVEGSTALYQAAEQGRLPVVSLLIERGANAALPGRNGITPLAAAAYMGSEPIVALLLAKGSDPKVLDKTQKAPIVYAVGRGFAGVTSQLLDHGVDVNARYGNDLTALMWAAGYSNEAGVDDVAKVLNLLIDRGARLDDQDNRGRTALMIAAETGHLEMVDLLLKRGANRDLRDKAGKSAADLASSATIKQRLLAH
jgi:ankyrin repeat protein